MEQSFLSHLRKSIENHWNLSAFSDDGGETYSYADFAKHIETLKLLLEAAGLKQGDKVAIIGKNSSMWAMNFFSIMASGYVAVPILHDFKPMSIHHIVHHSEAKVLIVSDAIWNTLEADELADLLLTLRLENLEVRQAKEVRLQEKGIAYRLFAERHPKALRLEDLAFHQDQPEELALISYTSGTSGFSKGVMIPYRALWGNMQFGKDHLKVLRPGTDVISILPMAHMYGLAFEVYTEVCLGVHIHFITRTPSPQVIAETFKRHRPVLIIAVPLILEKIVRKSIFPFLQSKKYQILNRLPIVKGQLHHQICRKLTDALGGNFYEVIIGGAAFNHEVESFLHRIGFAYTVGYGMTECAPLITYADKKTYVPGSVGRVIDRMEIRIDSPDPENVVGEIQTRGVNVMLGYYHNEEATSHAFTADGWLRTGDLGTIDKDGNLFIRGRSKNMLLGPNGQNIYPEELEDQLNALPYVGESLVVHRGDKLVALIHPDLDLMDKDNVQSTQFSEIMKQNLEHFNHGQPSYAKVKAFQIFQDEFEKTPKRSIKRYLYQ